ncbi:PHP domain-containing protein [Catellatospora sp. IY07-71]|uniref:PHP domain-containing protein n=1 Tax=Catellatospora sp. IY07-71 TaxID=2728827 RepID=UPI001BB3AEB4|nr:PHP domain-containing protein [Catellatospora sp. IY07-71]BCJ74432.1 PHP domain-containing protein [Catellatospora sp. IY07-71]
MDRDPAEDLLAIAVELERAGEAGYRIKAFRRAAQTVAATGRAELAARAAEGTLAKLPGLGDVTARCVAESLAGEEPVYLRRLLATADRPLDEATEELHAALRGDCHSHSDWSDGTESIAGMADAARALGREYLVLTDHSPRLTIARGLSAERLAQQLIEVERLNAGYGDGFRLLSGIEVDILDDGSLDQTPELLGRLDVVVASVHSRLRSPADEMTARMLAAVADPHIDILGHCTGRLVRRAAGDTGTQSRPESEFDAVAVFAACAARGVAVEINSRPDRLDPPKRLLRLAVEAGCLFAIDSDAHFSTQLDWLRFGCERAARCGVPVDRVVNTWPTDRLLAWTRRDRG